MKIPKDNKKLGTARRLRREMTPHERKLWYLFLQKYPVKIYKQRIIDRFIVDFYCASAKLVIEIDGSQHFDKDGLDADTKRTEILERYGLQVVRYTNREIDREFSAVCEQIDQIIKERTALSAQCAHWAPLPEGEARAVATKELGSPSGRAGKNL